MIHQLDFNGKDKVDKAIMRLQAYEPPEGYYLCFSGGKDSVVIKALADMAGVKYDAHYSITTVDPPEHRLCDCGGTPILEQQQGFDKYDTYAICPNCGCRTTKQATPYWAWKAWDLKELEVKENLTIWDMM